MKKHAQNDGTKKCWTTEQSRSQDHHIYHVLPFFCICFNSSLIADSPPCLSPSGHMLCVPLQLFQIRSNFKIKINNIKTKMYSTLNACDPWQIATPWLLSSSWPPSINPCICFPCHFYAKACKTFIKMLSIFPEPNIT